ncbi:MAG: hypothetical protein NVSMB2_19240 [Chloroflexota bacterium]
MSFPWLPLLVLVLVAILFLGLLAEIGMRIAELRASNLVGLRCVGTAVVLNGQKGLYTLDTEAGYRMQPNACVRLKSTEYDGVLKTNANGMVGPAVPATKPPGEFRIVVLGDSYAVGGQVPYEQTFPAVIEQRLHAAGWGQVRVIDAGVGGYTTFNEAGLLRENIATLQPDLVIVAAFLGNDVFENVLATAAGYRNAPEHPKGMTWGSKATALVDDSNRWFARNGPGRGTDLPAAWNPSSGLPTPVGNDPPGGASTVASGPPPTIGARVRGLWEASRSTSLLLGALFGTPVDPSVTTAPGARPRASQMLQLNLTSFEWTILRDPPRTYWLDVAWPLFGQYLADITVTAADAPVIVAAIPELGQVDDLAQSRTMDDFRFSADEVDWDKPQRKLAAQTRAVGIPLLDLLPVFRERPDPADLYLRLDTHFTALGHSVTADALTTFLEQGSYLP